MFQDHGICKNYLARNLALDDEVEDSEHLTRQ